MLWRAGSGHRHFLILSFRPQSRWFFLSSISKLAALSSPHTGKGKLGSISNSGFTGRLPRCLLSNFSLETSKLLAAIQEMSSTTMDRDQIRQHLEAMPSDVLENAKTACALAKEVVDKYCPEYAVHVLHISHRLGTILAHNQYEQVAYQLATRKHWNHVYSVAAMARKHTGRWTVRLLNWVVRSHVETQQYALLAGDLELFQRNRLQPTRSTYHLLVRGHLQNADLIHARKYLVEMQDAGFDMDNSTYLTILGAYRALGPNKDVEEQASRSLPALGTTSFDTMILNGLMQLRIDDGDSAGALRILEFFALPPLSDGRQDGHSPRAPPTSSQSPLKTLPDNTTFNILLTFLSRRKDGLTNVLRIFGQISAAGLFVDAEAVAPLLQAHFRASKDSIAVAIVAEMCKYHKFSVDPKEFQLLGRGSDPLVADVLHAVSVRPTVHIFNTLLQGVLPKHGFMGMRSVFRIMRQAGVIPDASTTNIIISYLSDVQHMRPRRVIRALRTLATFPSDGASFTIQHVNTILRSLLRRERDIVRTKSWNATAQRVRFGHRSRFSMERLSTPAKAFDPTAGIALTSFNHSVSKLFKPVIQSLLDRKVMSDSTTFALSIRRNAVMKMDLGMAWKVFDVMVARGISPNAYHFSAFMEGHVVQGDMDGAMEIMKRAARSGVTPNVVMYTILIIGYGRMGRPDLAMRTFSDMRSAGVDPDFAAIDALVSAYWFVRDYSAARTTLLELWRLVAPFPQELVDVSLHVLIQSFRALRADSRALRPSDSPRERRQRLLANTKLSRALAELKDWDELVESVSWAKEYVDLNPMLRMDISGGEFDQS